MEPRLTANTVIVSRGKKTEKNQAVDSQTVKRTSINCRRPGMSDKGAATNQGAWTVSVIHWPPNYSWQRLRRSKCSGYGELFGVNNRQFPATVPAFNLPDMYLAPPIGMTPYQFTCGKHRKLTRTTKNCRIQPENCIKFVKLNMNK